MPGRKSTHSLPEFASTLERSLQPLLPTTAIAASLGSSLPSRIVLKRPNADEQVERAAAIANEGEVYSENSIGVRSIRLCMLSDSKDPLFLFPELWAFSIRRPMFALAVYAA